MTKENVKKFVFFGLSVAVGIIFSFIPPFEGLTVESMRFAGIFFAMLILLITQAIPDWVTVIGSLAMLVLTKTATTAEAFNAFSGNTMWLIIMIFAITAAIGNSGLLNRIALKILSFFPASYTGAVVALMVTGVAVGPLIPSVTAKVNMIIPVATAATEQMGLKERSRGALGLFSATYLTIMQGGNVFTSGSVYVAFMLGFLTNMSFSLVSWFVATCVWFAVILVGTFLFAMTYCKPKEKIDLPPTFFKDRLKELGPITSKEKITGVVLGLTLVLWSTSALHGLDTAMVGWLAVGALTIFGVMSTVDFITRVPWSMVVFIGGIISLSSLLTSLGWGNFLASTLGPMLTPLVANPWLFVVFLCIFTYLIRFVIIDQITLLVVLMAIFAPVLEAAGISLFVLVFVQWMAGCTWNVPYQNPFMLATLQVAGNKYVTFKEARMSSFVYMGLHLIGSLISIPLWMLLGYIW